MRISDWSSDVCSSDLSERDQKELDAGLVELYRKAKSDLQEGGANTLFLALGVLKWKQSEHETRSYRAPLILVPVKIERKSAASRVRRSEEHTSELQSLMRISYAVFCLKKKNIATRNSTRRTLDPHTVITLSSA